MRGPESPEEIARWGSNDGNKVKGALAVRGALIQSINSLQTELNEALKDGSTTAPQGFVYQIEALDKEALKLEHRPSNGEPWVELLPIGSVLYGNRITALQSGTFLSWKRDALIGGEGPLLADDGRYDNSEDFQIRIGSHKFLLELVAKADFEELPLNEVRPRV